MIIDIHQHYLPKMPIWQNEPWQTALYTQSRVQAYADVAMVIDAMDIAGIDQIVWQGEYLVHMENCNIRNETVIRAMCHDRQRLRAFAIIQPNHPDAVDEIARCIDAGMDGVGELNPIAQGFSLRSRGFLRCAEYCAMHGIPMLFHTNEPVGNAYPGKVDQPMWSYYELAARFPELRMILAHWGGGLWFYEQIPSVRRVLQHVYYDTAASWLTYPDTQTMMRMAMMVVPTKVLFGSDYPLKKPHDTMPHLDAWFDEVKVAVPPSAQSAVCGATAHMLLSRQPGANATQHSAHVIDLRSSVVWLVETYPATDRVLERWGITVTAHTPWWQSIAHAAVSAGHHPQTHAQLLAQIMEYL